MFSMEVKVVQAYDWIHHILAPLFDFHDKRRFIEFYLNFRMPFQMEFSKHGPRTFQRKKIRAMLGIAEGLLVPNFRATHSLHSMCIYNKLWYP